MPNWKKVIVSGSNAILNNITSSGDISASGDIYATNFIGIIDSASHATSTLVQGINSPGFFSVLFSNNNTLYRDSDSGDFTYNPSSNTLVVDNISGTASLATFANTASLATLANTASLATFANTASLATFANTASLATFANTASLAEKIEVNDYLSGGSVDLLLGGSTSNLVYSVPSNGLVYNFDTNTLIVPNLEGTASYAITASYAANTLTVNGNVDNRILTATGNNTINGEQNLTFNGTDLILTGNFKINPQDYLEFFDIRSTAGGAYGIIGDTGEFGNSTYFKVDDENSNIIFSFGITPTVHTFDSTGLNVTGSLTVDTIVNVNTTHVTASGNIKANGYISASGDVYADNVRTDTIIFPNTNGKIITPEGQVNNDYIILDGTNRYFSIVLDNSEYFKVDFNTDLIYLNNSTKIGNSSYNNHQFTGSVDIKGDLKINGDITAEQYIINSTVTNVTMSFSSGSTIFGDSLNDTHLFTGSVDITGSLTLDGISYPTADGENGDVITTDGLGNLSIDKPKIYMQVKNAWPTTLPKGTPVYASSSIGNLENVKPASASNADTMPAIGVLASDLNPDGEGLAIVTGFINGVNTSTFNESDVVYVGADGGFTNVKPTGSNLIQNLGIVTKVDETNGSGFVYGSGRANDIPNISPGYAWVGNSDSVATAVPTSSFAGVGDNLGNHSASLDLNMDGNSIYSASNYQVLNNGGYQLINEYGSILNGITLENYNTIEVGGFNNSSVKIGRHYDTPIGTFSTPGLFLSGSITASGNISASGDIVGNSLYVNEFINIKGTEYPTSSFYTIETEPGQNFKEGVIHFSGSIDDVYSTVFDIFKISTGSNQILQLDYQVSWYRSNVLWTSVGHKSKLIVGPLMTPEGINNNNPTVGDFNVFISTGNSSYLYTNLVYPLDGGEAHTTWSSSFQDEYLQYSINYADSTYSDNIHENGDEVKININYKLIKSI